MRPPGQPRAARAARAATALPRVLGLALALGLALSGPPATAQAAAGPRFVVSLLTFGQGDLVFERFGHNAIRVQDRATGQDLAYNWGMFSFDQPNFVGRFLTGDTRYWVEAYPTSAMLEHYARADRETVEQELALTDAEAETLVRYVRWNAEPDNRFYRYDYFRDNCSTRARDVLDRALGGRLRAAWGDSVTAHSYRSEALRLMAAAPLVQFGMDIALGPRADRPLTAWEEGFVPMRLRDRLRGVRRDGEPLVRAERRLYEARRAPEAAAPRAQFGGALAGGIVLGVAVLTLVTQTRRGSRAARRTLAVFALAWLGINGVLGLALAGMWAGSAHVFWYDNANVWVLQPLGVVVGPLAALAVWRGTWRATVRLLLAGVGVAAVLGPMVFRELFGAQGTGAPGALVTVPLFALCFGIALVLREDGWNSVSA